MNRSTRRGHLGAGPSVCAAVYAASEVSMYCGRDIRTGGQAGRVRKLKIISDSRLEFQDRNGESGKPRKP